jgi:hypothetical protein
MQSSAPASGGWFRKLSSILFIIFCFELGLFLIVYPWTDAWTDNYFSLIAPGQVETQWRELWNNPFVRGGISGLGIINIWIALSEVFGLFVRRSPAVTNETHPAPPSSN